jgi:hypothetical protein
MIQIKRESAITNKVIQDKKTKMLEILKKKHFKLLLMLMTPKDEVLQVLPFLIAQAIMLAFQ